jgi:prolyl-tRNA synthetase
MPTRLSHYFAPTLREEPAQTESISHGLLLRAGMIRQIGSGLYSFLPLGWRVHQKVVGVIREEMDAIGGQEMLHPLLVPAELWKQSGRYAFDEVFKVRGRGEREYVLSLSHEETFTLIAKELRSYKELPQIWYHFGLKERDEPRPRAGLLRVREFIMKDSYSLDRDDEGLDASYLKHAEAYRRIFDRLGLEYYESAGDVGAMGGSMAHEYLAPTPSGENDLVMCENGDYAANVEAAVSRATVPVFPEQRAAAEEVETPGVATIDSLAQFLGIDPRTTSKAMPVVRLSDEKVVLGLLRGDHRLHELKMARALGGAYRPAHAEEILAAFGAGGGSLGPVGFTGEIVADELLREGQYVTGANRDGWHLLGVEAGRDWQATTWADLRHVEEGDACPSCGGKLHIQPAIEVGNIFKLGTRYSVPLQATYLDESSREQPIVMGSYGIGPARTMAAVIEQHHDEHGIVWPEEIAPFDDHIVSLIGAEEIAARAAAALEQRGREVLLDDREARAGEKFADADLFGIPRRITAGKKSLDDGAVDVRNRETGEESRVKVEDL